MGELLEHSTTNTVGGGAVASLVDTVKFDLQTYVLDMRWASIVLTMISHIHEKTGTKLPLVLSHHDRDTEYRMPYFDFAMEVSKDMYDTLMMDWHDIVSTSLTERTKKHKG